MNRDWDSDTKHTTTREIDRDSMMITGALEAGEPSVAKIVEQMRDEDRAVLAILSQLRAGECDVRKIDATRQLESNGQQTLNAFLRLQRDKPLLLKSLAGLASRPNWQKLLGRNR